MTSSRIPYAAVLALLVLGCGSSDEATAQPAEPGPPVTQPIDAAPPPCAYGQVVCEGTIAKTCDGKGGVESTQECPAMCQEGRGCVECAPGTSGCENGNAWTCRADGRYVSFLCDAARAMECRADGCHGVCSPGELGSSNVGCEFWPTVTANGVFGGSGGFAFGVLVGNASGSDGSVTITGGGASPMTVPLAAGEARLVELPFVAKLKGPDWQTPYVPVAPTESVNKVGGAYRIQSNVPIVAYQFNAATPTKPAAASCPRATGAWPVAQCYAYSTDASLLLPTHVLSDAYVVASYHGWRGQTASRAVGMGELLAITAATDDVRLEIDLPSTAQVLPWPESYAFAPGDGGTSAGDAGHGFAMSASQVVLLMTPGLAENESFAGAVVRTTRPGTRIQVIAGSSCAAIPSGLCSHVEDAALPTSALGKQYVLLAPGDPANRIPYTARVVAIAGETALAFDPASGHNPVTLSAGGVMELPDLVDPVVITASQPVAVTQYMNGRGDLGGKTTAMDRIGGPNALTVVPVSRYQTSYTFAASPVHALSFVHVVAPTGADVMLDGKPIASGEMSPAGGSGMSYCVKSLAKTANTKVHTVTSAKPIGIFVDGFDAFSSYLYAGGLSLESP
jgi:hypothetical protein